MPRYGQFPRQHADDIVQGIADGRGERQDLGQRAEQPFSDVTGELVGAAQEHRGPPVIGVLVVNVPRFELGGLQACGPWLMGDVVVGPAPSTRASSPGASSRVAWGSSSQSHARPRTTACSASWMHLDSRPAPTGARPRSGQRHRPTRAPWPGDPAGGPYDECWPRPIQSSRR